MKRDYEQYKKDILFEQEQLDLVILKIQELNRDITELKITALATYLMNFYNGIENILKRCAKEYYKKMPKGEDWHKLLLQQSYLCGKDRIPVFKKETTDKLYSYLTFRHFFIHGYGFKLSWDKMKVLVADIDTLWRDIRNQITEFMGKI